MLLKSDVAGAELWVSAVKNLLFIGVSDEPVTPCFDFIVVPLARGGIHFRETLNVVLYAACRPLRIFVVNFAVRSSRPDLRDRLPSFPSWLSGRCRFYPSRHFENRTEVENR